VMVSYMMFHNAARQWAKSSQGLRGYRHLYTALVQSMCPEMQFNDAAMRDIRALRHELYGTPTSGGTTVDTAFTFPDDLRTVHSVSFHIRRTDKLWGESDYYPATKYVQELINQVTNKEEDAKEQRDENEEVDEGLRDIEICFLATDDPTAHAELQRALTEYRVPCRLVHTPPGAYHGDNANMTDRYSVEAGRLFLTELSVLLETTYLIGTFGSNVDALAAVLRSCPHNKNTHRDPHLPYGGTYGVDRPHWYFR